MDAWRPQALAPLLLAAACAGFSPAGTPPPMPLAGARAADQRRFLVALDGAMIELPGPCREVGDHCQCEIHTEALNIWIARLVLYARQIEALRAPEPCGWWQRLRRRCA